MEKEMMVVEIGRDGEMETYHMVDHSYWNEVGV